MIETLVAVILWIIEPEHLLAWGIIAGIVALFIAACIRSADEEEKKHRRFNSDL